MMAVNKAFYNIKLGRSKSKEYKKEIIHCTTYYEKLGESLQLHDIKNNNENNYYVIFIDFDKDELKNKINELSGTEISVDNYAHFLNFEIISKHFEINEEKEIKDKDDGIQRAIYNRIAAKELK